jgi:hypothetical protein
VTILEVLNADLFLQALVGFVGKERRRKCCGFLSTGRVLPECQKTDEMSGLE